MVTFLTSEECVEYPVAMAAMEAQVAAIADGVGSERVWLLEHPPIYTAGTSSTPEGLRAKVGTVAPAQAGAPASYGRQRSRDFSLRRDDTIPIYETGRGGKYTYHGPGQRVAYVMLKLRRLYPEIDLRRFVCDLEQWIINSLQTFDIKGERREGRIGIWVVDPNTEVEAKIAALGIRVRRGVAFHGISINVNPDLTHFDGIIPCGITEYGVTSFEKLGVAASMADLDQALTAQFYNVFDFTEEEICTAHAAVV